MEQIYYGVAAVVYAIFIIRFILSWIGGEFEFDGDFDGNADFDMSDLVSFKGFTHFLMGVSGWLSVKSYVTHNIMWWDYLIAIVSGVVFVIVLYFTYKFMMSLETKPQPLTGEQLIGKTATIYVLEGHDGEMYKYVITVNNGLGTMEYPAKSAISHNIGDSVVISDYKNAYFIV